MGNVVLRRGSRFTALESQFPTNHSIIGNETSFSQALSFTEILSWKSQSKWPAVLGSH